MNVSGVGTPDPTAHGQFRCAGLDGTRILATCATGIAELNPDTGALVEFTPWKEYGGDQIEANAVFSGNAVVGISDGQLLCLKKGNPPDAASEAAPAASPAEAGSMSSASAPRDISGHPGCKRIGGGHTRIAATDSAHILAWIGDRLTLVDAANATPVWSRRLRPGAIHTQMDPDRIALVYPEQVLILDRPTGNVLQRFMTPISGSEMPEIGRITTAGGQDEILAVAGGKAVHVLDIRQGDTLCAFRVPHPVRSVAALTNAVLTLSQSSENPSTWRADLHAVPSGKPLAGRDLNCRRSWEAPPSAVANLADGVLAAFSEGTVLHHLTGRSGEPLLRGTRPLEREPREDQRRRADA